MAELKEGTFDIRITDVRIEFNEFGAADLVFDVTLDGTECTARQEFLGDEYVTTVTNRETGEEFSGWYHLLNEAAWMAWKEVNKTLKGARTAMAAAATDAIRAALEAGTVDLGPDDEEPQGEQDHLLKKY